MNSPSSQQKFRKILFWFIATVLACHIVLAATSVFFNVHFLPKKLESLYEKLLVLGPFFIDSRIKTSPHLYVSYSTSGSWSPFQDVGGTNFEDFQHHPWRYDKLKWSDYERYTARKAFKEIKSLQYIDGSEGVATDELIQYMRALPQHAQSDSIKLVYVVNTWQPESQSIKADTVFAVIFKSTKDEGYQ